ncbi:MAG TPA: hypothetical protein VIE66_04915 [Methylocella sp.]|jgi:hypothetical protein
MIDIDEILAAAIRTIWLQINGPSTPTHRIEVETARRVRVVLEREGFIITPRPTPEVWQPSSCSIPIELNASNDD